MLRAFDDIPYDGSGRPMEVCSYSNFLTRLKYRFFLARQELLVNSIQYREKLLRCAQTRFTELATHLLSAVY